MKMSQQLRMVLSSIDEDNLSPDIADRVMAETKATEERGSGQLAVTEYQGNSMVSMSGTYSHRSTINVVGSGYVFVSATISENNSSWGTHKIDIKQGDRKAFASETFRQDYTGEFGTSASAMIKVENGNQITIDFYSNRYAEGSSGQWLLNAVAIGCVLESTDLIERS